MAYSTTILTRTGEKISDIAYQSPSAISNYFTATLKAASWSGSAAPYSQAVTVSGITTSMNPILVSTLADGATAATQKSYNKAYAIISQGTANITSNGNITFKVYKKPSIDITVGLKGE